MKKLNVKKFFKYVAICILATYFISGLYKNYEMSDTNKQLSNLDNAETEKFLSEYQDSIYSNNKLYSLEEIEGCIEIVKYINEHPDLKEFASEEHNREDGALSEKYYDLYDKITTLAYEQNCSIVDIKHKFENGEKNEVWNYYESTNYSPETFSNIIGLIDIGYTHHGISFNDYRVYKCREILRNENITADEELKKIKSEDYTEISKYEDERTMIGIKYPYALEIVTMYNAETSNNVTDLIYSIVIGIFLGVIIYAYSETKKIWHMIVLAIVELVLIALIEGFILNNVGGVSNNIVSVQAGSSLPINVTSIVAITTIAMVIIKVIINVLQVKKINDLKDAQ